MNSLKSFHGATRAATLIEVLVGSIIAAMVLGAIVLGTVALQRTYNATDQYSRAMDDEMLVTDYIARDLRSALTVTVSSMPGGAQKLSMTLPDFIDPATGKPRAPVLTRSTPTFGTSTGTANYTETPLTVAYYVQGQSLVREVGTTKSIISNTMQSFQLTDIDAGLSVSDNVSFVPKFSRVGDANTRLATSMPSTIYLRNKRRN